MACICDVDNGSLRLYFLFGAHLTAALNIIDRDEITAVVASPSGRRFWKVQGGSSAHPETYRCFKHFCPCQDFHFNVVVRKEELFVRIWKGMYGRVLVFGMLTLDAISIFSANTNWRL
jgi:hypothetical protein